VDWHRLRQQGFLTLAIALAGAVLLMLLLPVLDLKEALMIVTVFALLLGWLP
jgi:hypothetical protein